MKEKVIDAIQLYSKICHMSPDKQILAIKYYCNKTGDSVGDIYQIIKYLEHYEKRKRTENGSH